MTVSRRILYIIGSLHIGGAERHLVQVATGLKQAGDEPELFVLSTGGPLAAPLLAAGVPVHGFTPPAWLRKVVTHHRAYAWAVLLLSSVKLLFVLWRRRPDVVHFFLPAAYVVGGLVSLFRPVQARIMSRRSLNHYQSKHLLFARIERFLHHRMTLVCGNSQAVNRQLEEEGVPHDRIRLIYNGVAFPALESAAAPNADRGPVFIMVANLIPYKGHADLLDAFAGVQHDLPPDWTLRCVGRDDGIQAALSERAQTLGIGAHVEFLGSRTDVPALLQQADVGVLSSHEEGFSNAVLEGMAAGLPMVVTDVGGNAEAVVDGETGYVVPAHDPVRLGEALLAAARNRERAAMGERGRRRAQELFSVEACLRNYQHLYEEAVPARRRGLLLRRRENT